MSQQSNNVTWFSLFLDIAVVIWFIGALEAIGLVLVIVGDSTIGATIREWGHLSLSTYNPWHTVKDLLEMPRNWWWYLTPLAASPVLWVVMNIWAQPPKLFKKRPGK